MMLRFEALKKAMKKNKFEVFKKEKLKKNKLKVDIKVVY